MQEKLCDRMPDPESQRLYRVSLPSSSERGWCELLLNEKLAGLLLLSQIFKKSFRFDGHTIPHPHNRSEDNPQFLTWVSPCLEPYEKDSEDPEAGADSQRRRVARTLSSSSGLVYLGGSKDSYLRLICTGKDDSANNIDRKGPRPLNTNLHN